MTNKIICAGFGGQGLMSLGLIIAYAGMFEEKEVSWYPSYGAEMRGGTANCSVVISDKTIGSPLVTNDATVVIAMNLPSLIKFESALIPKGKIFVNSSLVDYEVTRSDIDVFKVPANDIADANGNQKMANMVMLGAMIEKTKLIKIDSIIEALPKVFGESKAHLNPLNKKVIEEGIQIFR
ncbi:MAG: 2-oxoacid:acceptor oxidoreductase family protein [Treponemataceae bacterium]